MTGQTGMFDAGAVVITGASGGIGSAIARAFAERGMPLVLNDYGVTVDGREPSGSPVQKLGEELRAAGADARVHFGSVSSWESAEELITLADTEFGGIAALVTCHGILRERMIFNLSKDEWRDVVDVHLTGTFNCVRHATARMRAQRYGNILCVTSGAGLEGNPAQANYAAAKSGIVGLAYSTALAMGKYHVNVNCLAPSAATRMTDRLSARSSKSRKDSDRADAVLCGQLAVALAERRLRDVTGQVFSAAADKLARYSQPSEVATSVREHWDTDDIATAIREHLGSPTLRRFLTLGLPTPTTPDLVHTVDGS